MASSYFLSDNDAKMAIADTSSLMRIMGFNEDTIKRWMSRVDSWHTLEKLQQALECYAVQEDYYKEQVEKKLK